MQTLEQRAAQANSKHRKGWMTGTSSSSAHKKGWITDTTAPHYPKQQNRPTILRKTSEAITVNCQSLSANLIDTLAQSGLDWISLLSGKWRSAASTLSLPGIGNSWDTTPFVIETWVQATQQEKYYPVVLHNEKYWIYTHSLYSPELGRVRFVVCRRDRDKSDKYVALITNRLDWSPSNIISQCLGTDKWPGLLEDSLI